ncbi:MAG: hypothetical protein HC918_06910 [Oscillatoriales cyanobacterium SM2_1_8]|nr:hypothetical protein [Oscillatoriales cyanobacterium SM2_1_8]
MTPPPEVLAELREQFAEQLNADRDSVRLQAVTRVGEVLEAAPLLQEFLEQRQTAADFPGWADGRACQLLVRDRPWPHSLFGGSPVPWNQARPAGKVFGSRSPDHENPVRHGGGGGSRPGMAVFYGCEPN